MNKRELTKKCKTLLTRTAVEVAKLDVNTTCPFISYQPRLPKSIYKLKKYDHN
ncbi:MAG: cyclic lactone autoinducer peptide [Blautia sp.]|uniref:cyclic lactone autoinducer peptide n=1 Tax=Blautia sp. TaxID=1955243 RepID=UPI002A7581BB|nr:cyclic lactone autoinducer peptide [Blautia sp.]MDY3017024.1 cyclic lactone autoinducer peptide [Blautia sp.]